MPDTAANNPRLAAALDYAARGMRVLPVWQPANLNTCACPAGRACATPAKHPLSQAVPHGVHDATTDPAIISRWWRRYPDASVAVATGNGLVVIDVDPRNGGDVTLAELDDRLGSLPETVVAETGGGGWHLYVRAAGEFRATLGKGVDVKSDGGYVLAPPSRHASGRAYRWRAECAPDEIAVAELPERWLVALQRPARPPASAVPMPVCQVPVAERVRRARSYVAKMPVAVSGQGGHRALWDVAVVVVRGFMLEPDRALPILREYSERCLPPWGERDLAHKVSQAQRARVPWGWLVLDSVRPRSAAGGAA